MNESDRTINWLTVEEFQKRSYHGGTLSTDELRQCERAARADSDRYTATARRLRREYAASWRGEAK